MNWENKEERRYPKLILSPLSHIQPIVDSPVFSTIFNIFKKAQSSEMHRKNAEISDGSKYSKILNRFTNMVDV